jgi:hypothetical protein
MCSLAAGVAVLIGLTACASGVTGTPAVGTGAVAASPTASSSSTATTPTTTPPTSTSAEASDVSVPVDSSGTTAGSTDVTDSAGATLGSGVTIDELADDLDAAQKIVDGFWATHWSDYYTGTYEPPTVKGLYDGTDPNDTPTCDGEPLEAYNAFYCASEDYVAWDASLLVDGADLIGDSWVYLIVAHEWGHAIQARLEDNLVSTAYELQADCLGAAAMYGAVADGTLQLEPGDDQELIGSLTTLADQMPWTMSADHGDPFERVQWFTLGRNGGVEACFEDTAPSTTTSG